MCRVRRGKNGVWNRANGVEVKGGLGDLLVMGRIGVSGFHGVHAMLLCCYFCKSGVIPRSSISHSC